MRETCAEVFSNNPPVIITMWARTNSFYTFTWSFPERGDRRLSTKILGGIFWEEIIV